MYGSPAGKHKNVTSPVHRGSPSLEMLFSQLHFKLKLTQKELGGRGGGTSDALTPKPDAVPSLGGPLDGVRGCELTRSGSLRIVLLVAVQLVRVVGGHVGKILEDVLVGFIPWKRERKREQPATAPEL